MIDFPISIIKKYSFLNICKCPHTNILNNMSRYLTFGKYYVAGTVLRLYMYLQESYLGLSQINKPNKRQIIMIKRKPPKLAIFTKESK